MISRDVKAVLIGLGWMMSFSGSTVFFGALGYWLWGDLGILLCLTPVGVAFVLISAFLIGDASLDDRSSARMASEEEILAVEAETAP